MGGIWGWMLSLGGLLKVDLVIKMVSKFLEFNVIIFVFNLLTFTVAMFSLSKV